MKLKKTNLGKCVHYYENVMDFAKQMDHDVAVKGKEFEKLLRGFSMMNPYDELVLISILTNLLAYVQVHAEHNSDSVEDEMKEIYKIHLNFYREEVKKHHADSTKK